MPDAVWAEEAVTVAAGDSPHPRIFKQCQRKRQHTNKGTLGEAEDVVGDEGVARNNHSSPLGIFPKVWQVHFPLHIRPLHIQRMADTRMVMPLKEACPHKGEHRRPLIRTS
jgi:hypothetical protein